MNNKKDDVNYENWTYPVQMAKLYAYIFFSSDSMYSHHVMLIFELLFCIIVSTIPYCTKTSTTYVGSNSTYPTILLPSSAFPVISWPSFLAIWLSIHLRQPHSVPKIMPKYIWVVNCMIASKAGINTNFPYYFIKW